ncbi:MAG: hypothetical protein ABIV11_06130, partial [Gemmatimonadaceae bacterium]
MEIHGQGLYPATIHLPHGKDRAARSDTVAGRGKSAERSENVASDRGIVLVGYFESEALVQIADVRAARYQRLPAARFDRLFRWVIVLVEDLANDLLEQILHRDDARGSAELV